jgi:glycerol-3-phosphate dehydrogenase
MGNKEITVHYSNIIIGGGIVGAGILRDLTLHGKKSLLIEKGDFSSQTSQGSSKMLHGGIRYLENFDFALVFEALREKKNWLRMAPHISTEIKFYLPVYKYSKWPLFFLRIGLFIYDLLSLFKNPPYQILNKDQTIKGFKGLNPDQLSGAGVYSDGIIDDSKLALDLILESIGNQSDALNYHEVINHEYKNNIHTIQTRNTITNDKFNFSCDNLIFSAGPFTDQLLNDLKIPWTDVLLPSKGSHLWIKKESLDITEGMVLQTKDNRIIFVIPHRNAILVGTTEIPLDAKDDFFNIKPTKEEEDYLIENLNFYFPDSNITEHNVLSSFAAVRPLVKSGTSSSKTSRHHKLFTPLPNCHVVVGGKYTTFRVMAKDVCQKVFKLNNWKYNKKLSLSKLSKTSIIKDVHTQELSADLIEKIIKEELVKTKEDLLKRRLSLYSESQFKDPDQLKSLIDNSSLLEPVKETKV